MSSIKRSGRNERHWYLCAVAGPTFFVGLAIFWALIARYVPPQGQNWSLEEVMAFYRAHTLRIRFGLVGATALAPLYFVWSTVISRVMSRLEGPDGLFSRVELLGGVSTTGVILSFSLSWLTASFRVGDRAPGDVQLLHDMGWIFFNLTFVVTLLQMVSFGTFVLIYGRLGSVFPDWLGWASYVAAGTFLFIVLMPFVMTGPFAWHGLLTFWVSISAYFIWALSTSYFNIRAIDLIRRAPRRLFDDDPLGSVGG